MRWLDFLFPLRADEHMVRDISEDDFLALVVPRIVPATRPGTVALLPFHDPRVRALIHEAKYRGNTRAHTLLGSALAEYLRDADDLPKTRFNLENSDLRLNLVLVPIPLGKERLKERGFNQVEEIACRALRSLGDHFILNIDLLKRVKETQSQVSLERRRREKNMHNAFGTTNSIDPSHTYVILDDVLTTGATLQAAIDALKKAGAEHIIPLALAH